MFNINHISEYYGSLSKHDENARVCLSNYAYNNLWPMIIRKSERLQYKIISDTTTTIIWPIREIHQKRNSTNILSGKRCLPFSGFKVSVLISSVLILDSM